VRKFIPPDQTPGALQLRASFENREAIYLEKGALKVRVSNIHGLASRQTVFADVEEIPAAGLGVGLFARPRNGATVLRWRIGAGYLSQFSDQRWAMGYGGWSLYFDPSIIQGVLDLASRFPENMDTSERYNEIVRLLQYDQPLLQGQWRAVFPGA